jgi:hypothetical protein
LLKRQHCRWVKSGFCNRGKRLSLARPGNQRYGFLFEKMPPQPVRGSLEKSEADIKASLEELA